MKIKGSELRENYYITKYALTKGIQIVECGQSSGGDGFVYDGWNVYRVGQDAHETLEHALARGEQMRIERIASIKKQIVKLETMSIKAPS